MRIFLYIRHKCKLCSYQMRVRVMHMTLTLIR